MRANLKSTHNIFGMLNKQKNVVLTQRGGGWIHMDREGDEYLLDANVVFSKRHPSKTVR